MTILSRLLNLTMSRFLGSLRHCSTYKSKMYMKANVLNTNETIKKYAPKLIYNTVVEKTLLQLDYNARRSKKYNKRTQSVEPLPVTLKYLSDDIEVKDEDILQSEEKKDHNIIHFPLSSGYSLKESNEEVIREENNNETADIASETFEEVSKRYELQKEIKNWMLDYDNYDDQNITEETDNWKINYGTPDPNSEISNVPCGGCGALLHCKDTAIPGYIPSEIFKNSGALGGTNLESITCQRCHFLKTYNMALQVQVLPEDYPKVLSTISQKGGLVILMVDLLDFPCSVWPGIGEIFGSRTPIVVVGNKIDLLPADGGNFLKHVKTTLINNMKLQGFATFNIKEVALISAKTGYGIEDLITKLNSLRRIKGDVYIVGCTNVGKSSLFNAFLQSDYCKVQAINLIQRATTSVWPGTTLNLLKFPIKRPAGYRQYLRHQRLRMMEKIEAGERQFRKEQLKRTGDPKYASLIGHIDVTKNVDMSEDVSSDLFMSATPGLQQMGINENSAEFALSKWCYDTPGVVQPDQITHLLTTEELLLTLPKDIIIPRTFCVKPNSTLFVGGLARLDYLTGDGSVKLTVFSSNELPITVCSLEDSDQLYDELLGTELFKVPTGNTERMSKWPKLQMAQEFSVTGVRWYESANDIVLSSAGWIAITGRPNMNYHFRAWTPEKRGAYVRNCLLPHAVALMGKRIKRSVAYHQYKFFVQ